MSTIHIGWVGSDTVDVHEPNAFQIAMYNKLPTVTLQASWSGSTLAKTLSLRDQLIGLGAYPDVVWPFIWSDDSRSDGYVRIIGVNAEVTSLVGVGEISASIQMEFLGREIEMQSLLTGTVITNAHGVTDAEAAPFHALPKQAFGRNPSGSRIIRPGLDGAANTSMVFTDVTRTDHPTWVCSPQYYLYGAARFLDHNDNYVLGREVPGGDSTDWTLSNGIIKITPHATVNRLTLQAHNGVAWEGGFNIRLRYDGVEETSGYRPPILLVNTPELVVLRLRLQQVNQAVLDLALRRGSVFVSGYYTQAVGGLCSVRTGNAGTAVTPAGAATAVGVYDNTAVNDHRLVLGSAMGTTTAATTDVARTSTALDFFAGVEMEGAAAQAGDTAADMCLQYLGHVSERTAAR